MWFVARTLARLVLRDGPKALLRMRLPVQPSRFNSIGKCSRSLAFLAATLTLASCYVPDKFKAELRLSRFGDYSLAYQGDLIYAPILHDYVKGNITPENEAERHDHIKADLIRDSAFKSVEHSGKGRFTVKYERSGRLGKTHLSAILRRDARMITLRAKENNLVLIDAFTVKPADAQKMAEMKVSMKGEFRVVTDGNIIRHNASDVRQLGTYNVYIWTIENALSPVPHLVMIRDPDPARPLEK